MKNCIILLSAIVTTTALASDWALKNESDVFDLMSLSPKTKFTSTTSFLSQSFDDQVLTLAGQNYFTRKHSNSALQEEISYGILENLEIGLGLGYQLSDEIKLNYGPASGVNGTSETYKRSGLKTSELNAKYRLLNQANQFSNADLILQIAPKLGTSKDATAKATGNALSDSTKVTIGFDLGKKFTDMSWRLGIKGNFYGSGKFEDVDNSSNSYSKDSYSDILIDGSWQWLLDSKYILNLTGGFGSLADSVVTANSTHLKSNEEKHSYGLFGVEGQYLLSKDTIIGAMIESKSFGKTNLIVTNTQTNATSTIPEADTSDTIFGLSIKTEFKFSSLRCA